MFEFRCMRSYMLPRCFAALYALDVEWSRRGVQGTTRLTSLEPNTLHWWLQKDVQSNRTARAHACSKGQAPRSESTLECI